MRSIIYEFYHGKLHPNEHNYCKDEGYLFLTESSKQDGNG